MSWNAAFNSIGGGLLGYEEFQCLGGAPGVGISLLGTEYGGAAGGVLGEKGEGEFIFHQLTEGARIELALVESSSVPSPRRFFLLCQKMLVPSRSSVRLRFAAAHPERW
jgi:hypothetical protein